MLAFIVGAFNLEFKTFEDMVAAFKTAQTLLEEFTACTVKLIELINSGTYLSRLRGAKKGQIMESMQKERVKAATLVQKEGLRVLSKFKAMPLDKYMAKHPTFDPKSSGALVRSLRWPGRGLVECILLRKGEVDEVDVELETTLHSVLTEELESSNNCIREGQVKTKYDHCATALGDIARHRGDAAQYEAPDAPVGKRAGTSAEPTGAAPEPEESADDAGSDDDDDDDPLVSSLLSDYLQKPHEVKAGKNPGVVLAKGRPGLAKAKAGSAKTASSKSVGKSTSSVAAASGPVPSPKDEPAVDIAGRIAKKGAGKGKRVSFGLVCSFLETEPRELSVDVRQG